MRITHLIGAVGFLAVAMPAFASGGHAPDHFSPVVLALAAILAGAKIGGHLALRLGQPAVLGELLVGILLGNLSWSGLHQFESMKNDATLDALSSLGVIILLFEVGLESTIRDMLKVGLSSFLVALLGVITPFGLGWLVGAWLLPDRTIYVHLFIGATLTATSVGITARVLKDLGKGQSPEARVIIGAAVIDDVLGLVILAAVSGLIQAAATGTTVSSASLAFILVKSTGFLFGALLVGTYLSPVWFSFASRLKGDDVLLAAALTFCFVLAYLAAVVGLAPIVGAYAAGLILESVHFEKFKDREEHELEELMKPISAFLVPVFFVVMGMRVDVSVFGQFHVVALAGALTVAAILGKQACSLGAIGSGADRLSVGIGMIPRGEVGLIFANIGLSLVIDGQRIIDEGLYSAIVVMVLVTTLVTPPALKWSLSRRAIQKTQTQDTTIEVR